MTLSRRRTRTLALFLTVGIAACHHAKPAPKDFGTQDLRAEVTDGAMPGDAAANHDAAAACGPSMTYGGGETSMTGAMVTAKIVDETGTAVPSQPVYICGLDVCSAPGSTMADGTVSIMTSLTEKKPAFKYGDTVSYAELAIPLTMATTDFTTGGAVLATGKLSDKPGAALTPGTSATSGNVTITLPASDVVGIDTLVYTTSDMQMLRTVSIPLTNVGPILNPVMVGGASASFALLYGVAPSETTFCPPVQVTVALSHATMSPNDEGWAAGTKVEFWVMTTDTAQVYAPYAGWAKISDGVVATDGMSVTTVAGQGFGFLESFAIRKAQ